MPHEFDFVAKSSFSESLENASRNSAYFEKYDKEKKEMNKV